MCRAFPFHGVEFCGVELFTDRDSSTYCDLAAVSSVEAMQCEAMRSGTPFIGSEALEGGLVRKHELRTRFCAVYPDVYVDSGASLTPSQRAMAGWLWSHRQGVIAGLSAASLHGSKWIDEHIPIELIWPNARPPRGLHTHDWRLHADEFAQLAGLPVTTAERTAFDVGRRGGVDEAVARLDALGNATSFAAQDVLIIAERHRGTRGLRILRQSLELYDPGSASPRETWLRVLLIRASFPRPQTQIPVFGDRGGPVAYLDMGWPDLMIAVEYDGDQHRTDRAQYVKDIRRLDMLRERGWLVIRVVAEDRQADVIRRVQRAWNARLRGDREVS
jgi:hypothetical protein